MPKRKKNDDDKDREADDSKGDSEIKSKDNECKKKKTNPTNLITNYFAPSKSKTKGNSDSDTAGIKVENPPTVFVPTAEVHARTKEMSREEARKILEDLCNGPPPSRAQVVINHPVVGGLNHYRQSVKKALLFKGLTGAILRGLKDPLKEMGIEGYDDVAIDLKKECEEKHGVPPARFCSLDFANYPGSYPEENHAPLYPLPEVGGEFDLKDLLYNRKAFLMMKILAKWFHPQKHAKRNELLCAVMQIDKKEQSARFKFACCLPHGSNIATWEEVDVPSDHEEDRKLPAVEERDDEDSDVEVVSPPPKPKPTVVDLTESEVSPRSRGLALLANAADPMPAASVAAASPGLASRIRDQLDSVASSENQSSATRKKEPNGDSRVVRPVIHRTPSAFRTPVLGLSKVNGGSDEKYYRGLKSIKDKADIARAFLDDSRQKKLNARQRKKDEINWFASQKAQEMENVTSDDDAPSYCTQPEVYNPDSPDPIEEEVEYEEAFDTPSEACGEDQAMVDEEPVANIVTQSQNEEQEGIAMRNGDYQPAARNDNSPSLYYHRFGSS